MEIEVTVIMPSYNRYPLNLLSLYALEKQCFDLSKMEVILIDDASTDQTPTIKEYCPPYHFQYIRNRTNVGVAASRNIGLRHARGEIIIILDAETIVSPNYVPLNREHHLTHDKSVVIAGSKRGRIYTFLSPDFTDNQINAIYKWSEKNSLFNQRLKEVISQEQTLSSLTNHIRLLEEPQQVVKREDIDDINNLCSIVKYKSYAHHLLKYLREHSYYSPLRWMACLGFLSIKRSFMEQVGGYEENFKGWGPEDAEFAYRLYKANANFIIEDDLETYHQEHPPSKTKEEDMNLNRLLFQQKHPVLDVSIRALHSIHPTDYGLMEKIILEHQSLTESFPYEFHEFNQAIITLLLQIRINIAENRPPVDLVQKTRLGDDLIAMERILIEREQIQSYGKYNHLVWLFDKLRTI
ncbi:glycosyltransferase family 2 protein [Bacillus sp. X1(2014)]|uniref:glycosyltransferase family 2 protein n=1 Tax=Bacillus sp. X1(2014) TaxID=1565991 RepID=UPI0011A26777|nr:glycosyltransferase [Bacillus sp. X1(2014)]